MITKDVLDRWEETLRPAITATFPAEDAKELLRLARIGLVTSESLDALGVAVSELLDALKLMVNDCGCSVSERASGHKIECSAPIAMEAIAKAEGTDA